VTLLVALETSGAKDAAFEGDRRREKMEIERRGSRG
jgi:hypothetical protein